MKIPDSYYERKAAKKAASLHVQTPTLVEAKKEVRRVLNARHSVPGKTLSVRAVSSRVVALAQVLSEKRFYPPQVALTYRVVESLLDHDGAVVTALFSRQSGKTESIGSICAAIAITFPLLANQYPDDWHLNITDDQGTYRGYRDGISIGIYAPKQEQAEIMFERVRHCLTSRSAKQVLQELGIEDKVANGNENVLSNGSDIVCQSASEQSKIEGATHHLLIAEEAQDITDRKVRKCFAADTEFLSEDGRFILIKDLVEQNRPVLTPKDGFVVPDEWHYNGVQPVVTLTTDSGKTLTVTENHRNLVQTDRHNRPVLLPTTQLLPGYRIAVPDATPVFGRSGLYIEGYGIGSLLGDGCMRGGRVQFCGTHQQAKKLEEFATIHGCSVSVGRNIGGNVHSIHFPSLEHCKATLNQTLKRLSLWGVKGEDKHIPNGDWSKEFIRGLVEGLFETDGSVENAATKPCISFGNISKALVERLRDYLLRFGIHGTVHVGTTGSGTKLKGCLGNPEKLFYRLHIKGVEDIRRFAKEFDLGIKRAKVASAVLTLVGKKGRSASASYPGHLRFERIRSIEEAGEAETYCVTVPTDDHLLVTSNFVSSNSLHPMVASTMGTIVKVGTATGKRCDFYEAGQFNITEELAGGRRNHFVFPADVCAKYNSLYATYIEREKKRLGVESDEYQMSYNCRWLFERGMFLPTSRLLSPSIAIRSGPGSSCYPMGVDSVYLHVVLGIDWAQMYDSTIVTMLAVNWTKPVMKTGNLALYRKHVLGWFDMQGSNYEEQFEWLADFLPRVRGLRKIVTDGNTCGAPMVSRLQAFSRHKLNNVVVEGHTFSPLAKSDGYRSLASDFYSERISYPAGSDVRQTPEYKKFIKQFADLQKVNAPGGLMKVSHPDVSGAHDDYCDSLMLAAWGANSPTGFGGCEVSENVFMARRRPEYNPYEQVMV